ncbi:hypothetical protein GIB67_001631 [Kingdonia uniflora]|uniref:Uncharacterized protein n=1 Tax=Kingdonia uniflora TaxID=39325 RepID=A0A7J7L0Y1_9MAGN|nr:hypothetical protein GIB67_001631 [Kingdonia uniflora]
MANKDYGFGGLLCIDMETEDKANRLMHHLQNCTQFGLMAVSLGYYETLMSCSGSSTSSEMNAEEKELAGISPGLVRMSVGYSGTVEQRWSQFEKALSRMQDSALFNKKNDCTSYLCNGHPKLCRSKAHSRPAMYLLGQPLEDASKEKVLAGASAVIVLSGKLCIS